MIVTEEDEQQLQHEAASFFNWYPMPGIPPPVPVIPPTDGDIQRKISSVASSVRVVEGSDINSLTLSCEENRPDKVKSLVVTIESENDSTTTELVPAVPPLPPTIMPRSGGRQHNVTNGSSTLGSAAGSAEKLSRDSEIIIPAFPEPPTTIHPRRAPNVDNRHRPPGAGAGGGNYVPNAKVPLYAQDRTGSFSSDDSFALRSPKSPTRASPVAGTGMAPQDGTNSSAQSLIPRGTYTPITSSDDVPIGTPSDSIFAAARNGDLIEMHAFLNQVLEIVASSDSSSLSSSAWAGHNPKAPSRTLSPLAEILDEFEPIERLPVLCCAAVARKNKYQMLQMVLKAGANVECKEQRGGNTPLHLICETAPPPMTEPTVVRYKQDRNGSRIEAESVVELNNARNRVSQPSLMEAMARMSQDNLYDDLSLEETEEAVAVALRKLDEQDTKEQAALEKVREDADTIVQVLVDQDGIPTLVTRQGFETISDFTYQIRGQTLVRGGLEDQIRLLSVSGVPIDIPNLRGETPLLMLLRHHDSVSALATLLALGADPTHMAPFGPGTNPPEIHVDPMSMLTPKDQKRMSKTMKTAQHLIMSKQLSSGQQTTYNNDPNHILVLHGGALPQAAYYLRLECVRFLLENEIECSDPSVIKQAIVACKQSVTAQVNSSLVSTQKRILRILERDWKGSKGQRRRVLVAERTLSRKMKPPRVGVLLVALSVASSAPAVAPTGDSESDNEAEDPISFPAPPTTTPPPTGPRVTRPSAQTTGAVGGGKGGIPTTHFYTSRGPRGTEIELISQHGFSGESAVPRMPSGDRLVNNNGHAGEEGFIDGSLTKEIQGWRINGDPNRNQNRSPLDGSAAAGGSELIQPNNRGLLNKFRNIKRP